ncbi:IgGFc-binding protein-like [Pangasianodon hypophthalmus]|uniref:IgGFc-binding protein-like n=1 Tax=Pangasianodon hypophthalmus TaxID=310915 RepID=UPI002307F4E9|nr:IgGFc-binding protein-like [Pangasianodon hypophthalmus]
MKAALCTIAFLLVFEFCGSSSVSCQGEECQLTDIKLDAQNAPPAPLGTCLVMGDPHYSTFDGSYYNFMGNCTYIVAKNCLADAEYPAFQINTKNERNGNTQNTLISVVTVLVYGNTITFNRLENGLVKINDSFWNFPISLDNGRVKLKASSLSVTMKTDFGLTVQYDWDQYLVVSVPESFKGKMCGMCGNFNGKKEDDLTTPSGSVVSSVPELGKSWRVSGSPGENFCHDECPGQCQSCESASWFTRMNAKLSCSIVTLLTKGPLKNCKSVIEPNVFYENCLYDYCTGKDVSNFLCQTAEIYTDACRQAGIHVHNWRGLLGCPNPNCPANSHFESCACPATCENPTPSAECKANCVEACTCDDGYFWSGNKCVPKNQCGCMYKSGSEERYLQAGESIWADNICSKKCTCDSSNGQVVCENTSCPLGTACSVVNGTRGCQKVPYASCNIYGDPHYNTFDNSTYDFQGTCTYTAAQGCHLEGTQLTPFEVVVENEKWNEIQASPNVSMAKVVAVEVYGMTIILRRNQLHQVMINGVLTNIPVSLNDGEVIVQQEGYHNVIITNFGLRVAYDMVYQVIITLPGTYAGKTCGMCGNFNGNKNDEFLLPDGKETKDLKTFGAAWNVAVPGVVCDDGCSGDFCPKCPQNEKLAFEKDCSIITNPEGPFAACHSVINPESYFRDCVYDVCMSEGDQHMLCHSVAAYMTDCQTFGVKVKNWRTPTFCPLTCPANSVYEICAKACDTPCPGLSGVMKCNIQTCAEGCMCEPGFFNNGTGCITADQCGCYENGRTYKINETIITDNCLERLTCLPSGKLKHESISCGSSEVCKVKNGVRGCYPRQCLLESGGSFSLFSGETWTIASVGAYELVKVCNGTLEAEWFRVVVELGPFGSVVAVYVYFEEVFITLTSKQATWINGKPVTLPQQLNNEVIVQLTEDILTIEKKASLRVSFSLSLGLVVSVSDEMAQKVCGACGSDTKVFNVQRQGVQEYFALWRALDFPSALC